MVGPKKPVEEIAFCTSRAVWKKETEGESEVFTTADNLQRADLLSETLLDDLKILTEVDIDEIHKHFFSRSAVRGMDFEKVTGIKLKVSILFSIKCEE